MTFTEFIQVMVKQLYVWQMARGTEHNPRMARSAETRLTRTRRRIDDAVLARALTIADERRCAAVHEIGTAAPAQLGEPEEVLYVRCEYPWGHGPVQGRRMHFPEANLTFGDKEWDHAAPNRGVWWMEPEEAAHG